MQPELRNRLIFGVMFAAVAIGAIAHDLMRASHLGALGVTLIIGAMGAREYARMARTLAPQARLAPVLATSLALAVEGAMHGGGTWFGVDLPQPFPDQPLTAMILGLGFAWTVLHQMGSLGTRDFFANVGATVLGIIYLGLPLNLLLRLACLSADPGYFPTEVDPALRGSQLLLVFVAAVKMGDISAYFGGRALGRHKMCPGISPGKTWEGFACSFFGSIGGTYLFCWLIERAAGVGPFNGWWQPAVWGLVLGPLGAMGDLVESCMKRAAAVKDSGGSMPGFGGVLDLFDALVLAVPVAYLLALAM
jgi:CDP-diglyceride synthetase